MRLKAAFSLALFQKGDELMKFVDFHCPPNPWSFASSAEFRSRHASPRSARTPAHLDDLHAFVRFLVENDTMSLSPDSLPADTR